MTLNVKYVCNLANGLIISKFDMINYFKPNIICALVEGTNLIEILLTIVVCDNTLEGKTIGETWDNQGGNECNVLFDL
jgi:hypothetical protein